MDNVVETIGVILNDPIGRTLAGIAGGVLARGGVGIFHRWRNRLQAEQAPDTHQEKRSFKKLRAGFIAAGMAVAGSLSLGLPGVIEFFGKIGAGVGSVALGGIAGYTAADAAAPYLKRNRVTV